MRKLKIFVSVLFMLSMMMSYSNTALASSKLTELNSKETRVLVEQGYTEDGVFYEVYDVPKLRMVSDPSDVTINSVIEIYIERVVEYHAAMNPDYIPTSIPWSEQFDSYTILTGTLYFKSFTIDYSKPLTSVVYAGYVIGRV